MMQSETDIQARLQQMVDQEIYGQEALLLLQTLVVFRTPFSREGLYALIPSALSRMSGGAAFVVLCRWQWIRPASGRYMYQIDKSLASILTPTPEAQRAHFWHVILHGAYDHHTWHRAHWEDVCAALRWGLKHQRDDAHRFLRLLKRISHDINRPQLRAFLADIIPTQGDAVLRADLLYTAAIIAQDDADFEMMYAAYEEALKLYRHLGDTKLEALMLQRLGTHAWEAGDLDRARDAFTCLLKVRHNDEITLISLARITVKQKDWTSAYQYLIEIGIPNLPQTGRGFGRREMTEHLQDLGQVSGKLGRTDEAWDHFAQGYLLCAPAAHEQQWLMLWHWGEFEIERGNAESGCHFWQLALLAADAMCDHVPTKYIPWETIAQQRDKLTELEQRLKRERPDL